MLDQYDPATTAILVVDMQNAFCSPHGTSGSLIKSQTVHILEEIAPRIGAFIKEARSRGYCVIHTWVCNPANPYDNEFVETCRPHETDQNFRRFDANETVFEQEGFGNFLLFSGSKIERFLIIGVYSDACVKRHARHAENLGYEVVVPPELTYP